MWMTRPASPCGLVTPSWWTVAPIDEEDPDRLIGAEWYRPTRALSECRRPDPRTVACAVPAAASGRPWWGVPCGSPDTPNACPTCRSTPAGTLVEAHRRHCGRPRHGPCPDEWHACPAARSSSPDVTALADELRNAILDIDAHATPFGTDDDGFVSGGYLISVGSLHRALGVVGHSAAKCGGCRNCWTLDQWKAEEQLLRDELEAQATRITELERWKAEALVVLGQWDEVWEALGRPGPLGSSKAVEALTEAHRLRATDPPADVHSPATAAPPNLDIRRERDRRRRPIVEARVPHHRTGAVPHPPGNPETRAPHRRPRVDPGPCPTTGDRSIHHLDASISGEDPAEYAVPGTVTCTAATHDHPNQESL